MTPKKSRPIKGGVNCWPWKALRQDNYTFLATIYSLTKSTTEGKQCHPHKLSHNRLQQQSTM